MLDAHFRDAVAQPDQVPDKETESMLSEMGALFVMLLVILLAAEVFTNALEHLGEKLKISEGVTGSLFAAVGTALPETLVPLLAIFGGRGTGNAEVSEEIGVGAILGAPLMLSTLSVFLMALFALKKRGASGHLTPEKTGLKRDLNYFLMAFGLAAVAMFVPHDVPAVRGGLSAALVLLYFVYIMQTLKASAALVKEGHATEAGGAMFLARLGLPTNWTTILLQLLGGLALLVYGAHGFIGHVEATSELLGISALLLSLMIVPIATELPEKINSILWIRKHKDTLAFGNITGAMVFQGTLLPAIGIALTPWAPQKEVLAGIAITLVAAAWLRFWAGHIKVWHLFVSGALYLSYLAISLS
ncbi:sodium:calcium antiporter [Crenobacter cavernae]|nr:sodium:calcium antiporter [Crenobacter cavernae]